MYIVATISKNSYSYDKIEEIIKAGAEVLRFNFSHGSPEEMKKKIDVAKNVINSLGLEKEIKILADLPGNKIRLGEFPSGQYVVEKNQEIIFKEGGFSQEPQKYIPIDFDNISNYLKIGQMINLGDGEIGFEILKIIDEKSFIAKAINSGHIPALKAFNLGRGIDDLNHITDKTIDHIKFLSQIRPEWIAFSFVNSKEYLLRAKSLLQKYGADTWKPKIVSKIESPLAVKNIEEIIKESDIILIARGDLGLTTPIENIGIIQKNITRLSKKANKDVIVSTQILDSLLTHFVPSRSDVLDLTNIVLDNADGIMLAKETGISPTPGYSVFMAKKIIENVQKNRSQI